MRNLLMLLLLLLLLSSALAFSACSPDGSGTSTPRGVDGADQENPGQAATGIDDPNDPGGTDSGENPRVDDPPVDDPPVDDPPVDDPPVDDPPVDDPPVDDPKPGEGEVPLVDLAPPKSGFQVVTTGRWIAPATDVEFCEVVVLPGTPEDTYYVNRFEVQMHPWSHHVIVQAAIVGSTTEAGMKEGMSIPCVSGESAYGGDVVDVFGAQQPYNQLQLPEGVGRIYHGGQKLIFDYHYFNPTTEPIPARHALNFHTVPTVDRVADSWGFYNFQIFTLPGQQSKFAAECTFSHDIVLYSLTRHTHKWGRKFHVWHKGGDLDGQHMWTSDDFEINIDYVFEEPLFVPKGQGFRFQCEYDNTTDKILMFGLKTTDEMCILFGVGWSPDSLTIPDQSCQAGPVATMDVP